MSCSDQNHFDFLKLFFSIFYIFEKKDILRKSCCKIIASIFVVLQLYKIFDIHIILIRPNGLPKQLFLDFTEPKTIFRKYSALFCITERNYDMAVAFHCGFELIKKTVFPPHFSNEEIEMAKVYYWQSWDFTLYIRL